MAKAITMYEGADGKAYATLQQAARADSELLLHRLETLVSSIFSDASRPSIIKAVNALKVDALRAAFAWADALGEHIGAGVQSYDPLRDAIQPPGPAAPPPVEYDAACLCEVAACLWEAALAYADRSPRDAIATAVNAALESDGYSATRLAVIGLASECETAWRALLAGERAALSFDWSFAPGWLAARMGWIAEVELPPLIICGADDFAACPECMNRLDSDLVEIAPDDDAPIYQGSCPSHGVYRWQVGTEETEEGESA